MTISEYNSALGALSDDAFTSFKKEFGGDFKAKQEYVRDFVHNPEHERRICQLLNLRTEEEKLS